MDAEVTQPIDLGIEWDVGAPSPVLFQDEFDAYLAFELPSDAFGMGTGSGLIAWRSCVAATFGFPNDETQHGHRLWRSTGQVPPYHGAVEVLGSRWIAELETVERVHDRAPTDGYFKAHRHFVLLFHDSTLECIARDYEVSRHEESARQVIAKIAAGPSASDAASWHPPGDIRQR